MRLVSAFLYLCAALCIGAVAGDNYPELVGGVSSAPIISAGNYSNENINNNGHQQVSSSSISTANESLILEAQQKQKQEESANKNNNDYYLLGDEPTTGHSGELLFDKTSQFLPKLVATLDHWLATLERFTITREWEALMKVFNGTETILNMFSNSSTVTFSSKQSNSPVLNGGNAGSIGTPTTAAAPVQKVQKAGVPGHVLAELERDLPRQVETLTVSLNQLFPWHVWPWNNIDLYSTVDTFLNHGIFAFSKTTAGPERRIDYLPQMLESLFKSLSYDSFPKRCNDWSRIICDLELFYDRLGLAPPINETDLEELQKRKVKVKELMMGGQKSKLTQELVCIMFSSLSMQQFGATKDDCETNKETTTNIRINNEQYDANENEREREENLSSQQQQQQLKWSRQIRKALKLYKLSREALNDEQWLALYKQFNSLWSQMKISDRVIMVGRIIQLLTNCHMPREILESALWKDIYKYKNALNQAGDIVIEELNRSSENGQFTLKQLAIGSQHWEQILTRFMRLLPRLIESLSTTLTSELPELVGKFFDEKVAFFKGPCKGHSFSELVPSLGKHRVELLELERLICQQLSIKPSIIMSQINNLTNEFLAKATNFTNFGDALHQSLPQFLTNNFGASAPALNTQAKAAILAAAATLAQNSNISPPESTTTTTTTTTTAKPQQNSTPPTPPTQDGTSIIDELAANPRLAQIVAILQSSALDPPEVHAELPELDWVEAGTTVALFYETIQKLMSYEGLFVVFPEVENFQDEMRQSVESSKQMFTRFSKRDPASLSAYALDTVMPVALRTFQPLDSFHSECLSTFRDLFGETTTPDSSITTSISSGQTAATKTTTTTQVAPRQWQCAVSATNFASMALNQLVRTFNLMLRNILSQMSRQRDLYKFSTNKQTNSTIAINHQNNSTTTKQTNSTTCVLFDGSIETLMDNLPLVVDLTLETVLISSTETNSKRSTLKETLCSFESTLDPLGEPAHVQRQVKLREAICHLLHESSLATCSDALKFDHWAATMRDLNVTWFEFNAISVRPSFRGILEGVQEFLELFGKVKPSSMSDGLIARVLNFQSYWQGLMNKAVSSVQKYRERRFQVALQILLPIIYDNLLPKLSSTSNSTTINDINNDVGDDANHETRQALKTSILSARAISLYLSKTPEITNGKQSVNSTTTTTTISNEQALSESMSPVDTQLGVLFDWADKYSVVISETLVRTIARNISKLENLIEDHDNDGDDALNQRVWRKFCAAPVNTYLQITDSSSGEEQLADQEQQVNKALIAEHARSLELTQAKLTLCNFDWTLFSDRLFQRTNSSHALPAQFTTNKTTTIISAKISDSLELYTTRQLIRVALTKWGQVLDLITSSRMVRGPQFLSLNHWRPLQEKLPTLSPSEYEPTNFIWVWQALERLVNAVDRASSTTSTSTTSVAETLARTIEQLNCALDTVKGGISWENVVNIYQDRQDVLAAYNTLSNGIALATASADTFLAHKKFQKFLNNFVRPRAGLSAFCDMRDRTRLENVFSLSITTSGTDETENELSGALESFQEFICDTNLELFVQNINPISVCYHQLQPQTIIIASNNTGNNLTSTKVNNSTLISNNNNNNTILTVGPLADSIDRFVKLASLAILDAKLIDHSSDHSKPSIFDPNQWVQLRSWWLNQTEAHQGNSGLALTLVRLFQTLDSLNSEHVIWRAIFRSVHEMSEVSAYLVSAAGMENRQEQPTQKEDSAAKRQVVSQAVMMVVDSNTTSSNQLLKLFGPKQQQQLATTISNVMFPEVSNFISLKTFKQLRYIKSISDYFGVAAPHAQQLICLNLTTTMTTTSTTQKPTHLSINSTKSQLGNDYQNQNNNHDTQFELNDYKLNSNEKLHSLLCHYHSSQWLTVMNVVLSNRTTSLAKKANYIAKYLHIFTKSYPHQEHLESFIHGQQLENIEAVANTTVSYLIALTQPFRALTLSKISNISWHSIPNLLDSIDRHLCVSKFEQQHQQQQQQQQHNFNDTTTTTSQYQLAVYEPRKPDIETIICKLPSWNITQVYAYLSENIDLQNMISLAIQNNHTAKLLGITTSTSISTSISNSTSNNTKTSYNNETKIRIDNQKNVVEPMKLRQKQIKTCITPFKFASKWLKITQDLIDETMSKTSRAKIRKCLNLNKKNQSVYIQTMRYVKILNSLLSTINELTINNSWPIVKKTWKSISYALLNQSGQSAGAAAVAGVPALHP